MIASASRLLVAILLTAAHPAGLRAAEFVFVNLDGPGEGLNDATPAAPVGGNPGTTLGAQRLAVLQKAGEIWGGYLVSAVPIQVQVDFGVLGTGVLAGAAAVSEQFNFQNAPQSNTWYPVALANSLAGVDLEPGVNDISITANSSGAFYYGLDSATPPGTANFVDVLLHEMGHGLGFASFVNASTGNLFLGQKDVFSTFIRDEIHRVTWPDLTSAQRAASAVNDPNLAWNGPFTTAGLPQKLATQPSISGFRLTATFPGDFTQILTNQPAEFGPPIPNNGLSGELVITDTGFADPTDACGPLLNAAQVAGKIAFVRRGTCFFDDKVFRAQQAGAIAVVIANNTTPGVIKAGGDSIVDNAPVTISIPTVMVSQEEGDALLAASPGVQLSFSPIPSQFAGTYESRLRLYAPIFFSSGSSVSHWTTDASPNLLMEPFINPNLDRKLDLTLTQMKDIGWQVIEIPFPHLTYESWRSLEFGAEEFLTEPGDDPDRDGVTNLEEYFFGNDPNTSDVARLPTFHLAGGQAELVFTRSKLTTDLAYALEKSTSLDSFQPAVLGVDYQILSTVSLGTDAETVTLRLLDPPAALFLRLRITGAP
ncbi:MAG: PA domain-containing protein [Luteolibacter sp.]